MSDENTKDKPEKFNDPTIKMNISEINKLGHFILRHRLGKGGMGEVYLGEDENLKRKVAVKIIGADLAEDPKASERFMREAQICASLKHPGIIDIYYFGKDKEKLFFAMEYIEGESAADLTEKLGKVAPESALRIIIETAEALKYAHSKGVVHRDIKPANLLLDQNGRVKIADFGLSRASFMNSSLTVSGTVVGSPNFISPEQVKGESADYRSDIYSLGCTLYFLLMGETPFFAESPYAVCFKHVQDSFPQPDEIKKLNNGQIMKIINEMTAKSRDDRYQSYDEIIIDLNKAYFDLTGKSISSTIYMSHPFIPAIPQTNTTSPQSAKSGLKKLIIAGTVLCIIIAGAAITFFNSQKPSGISGISHEGTISMTPITTTTSEEKKIIVQPQENYNQTQTIGSTVKVEAAKSETKQNPPPQKNDESQPPDINNDTSLSDDSNRQQENTGRPPRRPGQRPALQNKLSQEATERIKKAFEEKSPVTKVLPLVISELTKANPEFGNKIDELNYEFIIQNLEEKTRDPNLPGATASSLLLLRSFEELDGLKKDFISIINSHSKTNVTINGKRFNLIGASETGITLAGTSAESPYSQIKATEMLSLFNQTVPANQKNDSAKILFGLVHDVPGAKDRIDKYEAKYKEPFGADIRRARNKKAE